MLSLSKIELMKKQIVGLCLSGEIDREAHKYLRWLYYRIEDKADDYRLRRSWKLEFNHIKKHKRRRLNQVRTR